MSTTGQGANRKISFILKNATTGSVCCSCLDSAVASRGNVGILLASQLTIPFPGFVCTLTAGDARKGGAAEPFLHPGRTEELDNAPQLPARRPGLR